ncbi:MAG: ribokinase [Sporichthyaceae bacterium]|nr:ribokinase [Sporichthyaceae bacterium]
MDLILRVGELPTSGETVLGEDVVLRPGGKGANQAVAAALAGARVSIAGCVGDDAHGAASRDALVRAGVDVTLLRTTAERSTGLAVVLVARDGENAIAVSPGANSALVPDDVGNMRAELGRADVLLMQMELPVDVVVRAVETAAEVGTAVVLNLAPAVVVPAPVLERLDVLVVNRQEAEYLLHEEVPDLPALMRAAEALRALGPGAVVVTAGGQGAVMTSEEGAAHIPAVPVDVVDTSGAGDAFVGFFAAEISRSRPLRDAVARATEAGSVAVSSRGAQLTHLATAPVHNDQ